MGYLSGRTKKLSSLMVLSTLLLFMTLPFLTNTCSAGDGTGVGVEPIEPRIANVEIVRENGEYRFKIDIFDLNGWAHVNKVEIGLYRKDELIDYYVYNQTFDFEDEFSVEKGEALRDHGVEKSDGDSVSERCTLTLFLRLRDRGYDRVLIRAVDDHGGTAVSTMDFPGIAAGQPYTWLFLPLAVIVAAAVVYKAFNGGESGG